MSIRMGFLNGAESAAMTDAHLSAGMIAGEPFAKNEAFDFAARAGGPGGTDGSMSIHVKDSLHPRASGMTERMAPHVAVFARERQSPPPQEVYALHRKLSGAVSIFGFAA